jgi:hypothetical protein
LVQEAVGLQRRQPSPLRIRNLKLQPLSGPAAEIIFWFCSWLSYFYEHQ